ncbi:hypothetical protein H6769_07350 [Candidatus Peribacteria bacterium]|nr:hypothetical protein [Candidatus Peribacteria bacterium]
MKNYWKIRIRRFLLNGLRQIKRSGGYKIVMSLPLFIRIFLAIASVMYGFVALFTPLPL